jgi:hypothetical protein
MELRNRTPHALAQLVELDRTGAEHLVLVLKAEFAIGEGGALAVAPPREPPRPADVFHGDPAATSIKGAAELSAVKPSTDVLLHGSAIARKPGTRAMDVLLAAGPIRKVVRVFGERRFKRSLLAKGVGDPLPFERVPLIWENAWGGTDLTPQDPERHGAEPRNPVGRGYRAKGSQIPWEDALAPQLEDPSEETGGPGRKGTPAGFGPIGRGWTPRRQYGGTYDEKWIADRMPLLPDDFDERFHQAAPEDQIAPAYFRGGERVELVGCVTEGRVKFALPVLRPLFETRLRARVETPPCVLDTVEIDAEVRRVVLLFKARVRVHGELPDVRWTECVLEQESRVG